MSTPAVVLALALATAVVAGARGSWSPCGLSMVSAINPMSERSRGNRYWLTCLWFVAGAATGGLALGLAGAALAAGCAAAVTGQPRVVAAVVAVAALVCLASDAGLPGVRLPLLPRQVNERWLAHYRRWLYAAGFGLQIGLGFATYVMTAATYLVVVLMAATGSAGRAVLVGVTFGVVRGVSVALSAGARDPHRLQQLHRRLDRLAPLSLAAAMAVELAGATALAGAAAGTVAALAAALVCLGSAAVSFRSRTLSGAR
jgi:MFS family permease